MTDLEIIKIIENKLNLQLRKLSEIQWHFSGFLINDKEQVTSLSLYDCKINKLEFIIEFLSDLKNLTHLNLSNNQITDIKVLIKLKNLTQLDIYSNQIKDISVLSELKNLTHLNLSNNQLTDINVLNKLKNLTQLDLYNNQLTNFNAISKLTNLTKLDLSFNQIIDFNIVSELNNLTFLNLSHNQLKDFNVKCILKNLTQLNLSYNQLSDIALSKLKNLTYLSLSSNQIRDIDHLNELKNLTDLYLYNNHITDINSLSELKNLTQLHLDNNKIKDINALSELKILTQLDLSYNQLIDITPLIKLYNNFSIDILVKGNPIKSLPKEIIKQGNFAIKIYFKQLAQQGKHNIFEAKLMIVGEPDSGKTTLMKKLFNRDYPVPNLKEPSTLGIEVRQNCEFEIEKKYLKKFGIPDKKCLNVNVWDFGGQNIQYMLHQFFLTSDCLYILMAEKKKELPNFDYWLNIIHILGKNSPVIILFNEINIDNATSIIYDEKKYTDLFPDMNLHKLDIDFSNMDDGRFDVLIHTIQEKISCLSHVGKEVPARWVDIRKDLESRINQKHISKHNYIVICNSFGITEEQDYNLILKYFHLLGIVLHFSEDVNLRDTIFLDPNWTVDAVYSVLTDRQIQEHNGVFASEQIDYIWEKKKYDESERGKLLQLMLKDNFELCYKIQGKQNQYIVPLLLTKSKPVYYWDEKENLQFRFQYPFMPKGIVSRLIVRLNKSIDEEKVWNEGVVLNNNTFVFAQIIEKETTREGLKYIDIRLIGNPDARKEFLTLIREEIKKIQDSSFPNLPYSEMVPCNCTECENSKEPEFFEYKSLFNLLYKNKDKQCPRSGDMIKIKTLIDAVYTYEEKQSKERYRDYPDYYEERFVEEIRSGFTKVNEKLTDITEYILSGIQESKHEIITTLLSRMNESDKMTINGIYRMIEENKMSDMEKMEAIVEINKSIVGIKDIELKRLAENLHTETDSINTKLKLMIPIIPGILKIEQDVSLNKLWKKWSKLLATNML